MIFIALAAAWIDQAFAPDLEQALKGQPLSGAGFHRAIDPVLKKHGGGFVHFRRTASDDRALVMAVTTKKPPQGEAYVFFIWPEGERNHVQALQSVIQYDKTWVDPGEVYWKGGRLIVLGDEIKSGSWLTAAMFAFSESNGKWSLAQHIDTNHEGESNFQRTKAGAVDPDIIDVNYRVGPKHLNQSRVDPHLRFSIHWKFTGVRYSSTPAQEEETPIAIVDRLAGLAQSSNHPSFNREVPKKFRTDLWRALKTCHEASSESETDHSNELTLDSNYFLRFVKTKNHWALVELTDLNN